MKNSELLELVGKKVSFEFHEDMHIGENKTITWQAGLSGELTCVVFTPDNVGIAVDDSDIFCFSHVKNFKVLHA